MAANKPNELIAGNPAALLQAEIERLKADIDPGGTEDRRTGGARRYRSAARHLQPARLRARATRSLAYVKRYGTTAALLFIDLDGFKAVNDRHGHAAGDALAQGGGARAHRPCARLRRGGAARRRRIRRAAVECERDPGGGQGARAGKDRRARSACRSARSRITVGASAGFVPLVGRGDAQRNCSMRPTRPCMRGRRSEEGSILCCHRPRKRAIQ